MSHYYIVLYALLCNTDIAQNELLDELIAEVVAIVTSLHVFR